MIYVYACIKCKKKPIEVEHSMSEVDNPTESLIEATTCHKHNLRMVRVPQSVHLMGASGGQFKTEKELLKDKQTQRKKRSSLHFKNEIMPKLTDVSDKRHFNKKFNEGSKKGLSGDHEKMK